MKLINFFDANFWIKEIDLNEKSKDNDISPMPTYGSEAAIVTNYLSLVYHWEYGNNKLINNTLLNNDKNIFFSFIIIPDCYPLNNFEKYVIDCFKKKVRLFRLFPKSHCFYIYDNYMKRIFEILDDHRFPVMLDLKQLDITDNKYFAINDIENILNNYKKLPFILECSLKQLMFDNYFIPLLDKYQNLYLEISGLLGVNQIENYVKRFSSKRLIYGTNSPFLNEVFSRGRILLSDLDDLSKHDISYNNIDRLIKGIKI